MFDATTTVAGNITVYAQWTINTYTVTFDKNGGDTDASPTSKTVTVPATTIDALPTQPARLGYTFGGWNTKDDGTGTVFDETTLVTADITVYAQWNPLPHYFTFTVRTTTANETFALPTSGQLNGSSAKSYTWNIDWGDTQSETASGASSNNSAGISHTYSSPGDYRITITPNGNTNAWLGAFGFADNTGGANAQTNKNKVISVDSPLTLLMTRTQAQISAGTAPTHEWAFTFSNCKNPAFKMGTNFKFAAEWDTITTVGDWFASSMFAWCSGADFTMNSVFNLPPGITTVGNVFVSTMFYECSGADFTMNSVFNLPPGITTVGNTFVSDMFRGCSGAVFTMNSVFNLPSGITTVGNYFATNMFRGCSGADFTMNSVFNLPPGITTVGNTFVGAMFYECIGADFTMNSVFNLPPGITTVGNAFVINMFNFCGPNFQVNAVFKFPVLSQTEANRTEVFNGTFFLSNSTAVQTRTAASIINGNPNPGVDKNTFGPAGAWTDYGSIHANWK
ncbi:hypothetical protein FACS1894163_11090 [Spirochaetia bacterium]|nr:hypothetical protein FACS1894163_11090 [Spirochaetia bacterium]